MKAADNARTSIRFMCRANINARYAGPPMERTTKVNKQFMVTVVSSMQYVVEFSEGAQNIIIYNFNIESSLSSSNRNSTCAGQKSQEGPYITTVVTATIIYV